MIQYLTGSDDKQFAQLAVLLQSLDDAGLRDASAVCDFGLDEAQKRFLLTRGQLAAADPPVPADLGHYWYRKAALVDYARPDADALVWIDADALVIGDPQPHVEAIVADMGAKGQSIAAAPDAAGSSVGDAIARFNVKGADTRRFVSLLHENGMPLARPYLNAGVFIAASRDWLQQYKRIVHSGPEGYLFEQNAFNVAAWRDPAGVRILDRRTWNAHGADLAAIVPSNDGLVCGGTPVRVLHATGEPDVHVTGIDVDLVLPDRKVSVKLRVGFRPDVAKMQADLFVKFVVQNRDALVGIL
jgi:hypothetical protein